MSFPYKTTLCIIDVRCFRDENEIYSNTHCDALFLTQILLYEYFLIAK